MVQRFVAHDGDRIHDVVWISENQFASFSRDQHDGIIHICQIGRETPVTTLLHGVGFRRFHVLQILHFDYCRIRSILYGGTAN